MSFTHPPSFPSPARSCRSSTAPCPPAQSWVCSPQPLGSPKATPGPARTSHSLLGSGTRPDSASHAPHVPLGSRAVPHEDLWGREKRRHVLTGITEVSSYRHPRPQPCCYKHLTALPGTQVVSSKGQVTESEAEAVPTGQGKMWECALCPSGCHVG